MPTGRTFIAKNMVLTSLFFWLHIYGVRAEGNKSILVIFDYIIIMKKKTLQVILYMQKQNYYFTQLVRLGSTVQNEKSAIFLRADSKTNESAPSINGQN